MGTRQNAGAVMPLQRKQEVYAVACEYDLLILEDDPYYILQFRNGALPSLFHVAVL